MHDAHGQGCSDGQQYTPLQHLSATFCFGVCLVVTVCMQAEKFIATEAAMEPDRAEGLRLEVINRTVSVESRITHFYSE